MCQEVLLDDVITDPPDELLNKLIKPTETHQFWIKPLAYDIHNLQEILLEEVT